MKKKLIYACVLLSGLLLAASCRDDFPTGQYKGDGVLLTVTVNMPGESAGATRAMKARAGGENQYDNHTDDNTVLQQYIADGDVYVLVFENTVQTGDPVWSLYAVPDISSFSGENGDASRTLTAIMKKPAEDKTIIIDVVANLVENGVYTSTSVAESTLTSMIGQSRENVYKDIGSFTCPKNDEDNNPYGVWTLDADNGGRYLPMWGQSYDSTTMALQSYSITPYSEEVYASCGLYRSVAKIGVTIDESCETFQLKEIYVYYPNNEGTFVSLPTADNWTADKTVQFTVPEVPDNATTRSIEYPLVYKWETALTAGEQYLNNIYVAEADNKNTTGDPVCLVVGGYYLGGDYNGEGLSDNDYPLDYYRIDLTSTATSGTTLGEGAYDIIRNHSYIFNILAANSPGTSDPDPRRATAGLEVEILDYTEVSMHGINSQYTLTVNQSLFAFEGATTAVGQLLVSTDGEDWMLVTDFGTLRDSDGNPLVTDIDSDGNPITRTDDWLTVKDTSVENGSEHTDNGDIVTIEPNANINTESIRNTFFYIKCGQILKRIDVVQDYTETGNSYIITEAGTYSLKIDVCGNGNTQAWTDDSGTSYEDISMDNVFSIEDVAYAAIIWETADGFVTIPDPYSFSKSGCLSYTVNNVALDQFGDWTGNVFDKGNGANALIGVFDSSNTLLWSYHIWALGDYVDEELTEPWVVGTSNTNTSTYNFMDRNLGAYSNLPGSKSFGLLYQWGRKDPFIGAYREGNEQDFRRVRKQYTRHYDCGGRTYVWSNYDDSSDTSESDIDTYTIQNPTTILENGLLSAQHNSDVAKGLWGTESYTYDASELGNKTMYDPCPPGYRVPSLNALSVWDGYNNLWYSGQAQHSSFSCRFVPVPNGEEYDNTDYRTGNGHGADFVSGAPFYGFWLDYANEYGFNSTVTEDTSGSGPGGGTTYVLGANAYGVNYYNAQNVEDGTYGWVTGYENSKPSSVTWIPMAGIYNGTMDCFGRAGLTDQSPGGSEPYLPASSLEVTSVLWANSPTSNNSSYPGGLLVHGTEGAYAPHQTGGASYNYSSGTVTATSGTTTTTCSPGSVATEGKGYWTTESGGSSTTASGWWTGSVDSGQSSMDSSIGQGTWNGVSDITSYNSWSDEDGFSESGRHFHSYIESNESVFANPSYAASVRCIRDKDAIEHTDDKILYSDGTTEYNGELLTLYYYESYVEEKGIQDVINLAVSYIEEWEVVSPGAKWVSINPTSGTTSSSTGALDAIKITYIENYLPTDASVDNPATAIVTIKTARGTTFSINIQYVGGIRGS